MDWGTDLLFRLAAVTGGARTDESIAGELSCMGEGVDIQPGAWAEGKQQCPEAWATHVFLISIRSVAQLTRKKYPRTI